MTPRIARTLAASGLLLIAPVAQTALAQTPPAHTGNPACADQAVPPGKGLPADAANQNLSAKLDRGNGVICPPGNVDPQMTTPAPNTGKMPVIPPPGSPGGDPTVQPK